MATTVINSNTINYWFTDEAGVEGTVQPAANLPRGLVLMTARNGRVGLRALSVEKVASAERPLIPSFPTLVDAAMYRYRINNAGNFNNGLSSSDLSRSNWCPGTVTNPIYVPLGDLPAGSHTFAVTIPQGAPEGSSFSYWCLSGVIVGEEVDALSADAAGALVAVDPHAPKEAPAQPAGKGRVGKKRGDRR